MLNLSTIVSTATLLTISGIGIITLSLYKKFYKANKVSKNVYVAGGWISRETIRVKNNDLRSLGFNITSKWIERENGINNPDDYRECSKFDINEIAQSDTVLAFMTDPKYAYRGTFTEIGCAIGSGKRIIVICDGICTKVDDNISDRKKQTVTFSHACMQNVFFWDYRIEHVKTFEDAVKLLSGEVVASPYEEYFS